MRIETVEAVGPFDVRVAEPVIHREQPLELKSRRAPLAVAGPANKASPLQHLEMLGDGRLGQRGGFRELDHACIASREALEDCPASGIGKCREGAAQRILGNHYLKVI